MFTSLKEAFLAYPRAFRWIDQHKLWRWLWLPGLMNLLLMIVLSVAAWQYSATLTNELVTLLGLSHETTISILFWLVLIVLRIIVLFLFFSTYRYINLILLSPVLALLAEKIYIIRTGKDIPFRWNVFANNAIRGAVIALKNAFKEGFLVLLLMLCTWSVVLAPIVPFALLIVQSYFHGFSMMDYFHELEGLSVKGSADKVWERKWLAIGNGIGYNGLLFLPIFGSLVAPILSLTAMYISIEKEQYHVEIH